MFTEGDLEAGSQGQEKPTRQTRAKGAPDKENGLGKVKEV